MYTRRPLYKQYCIYRICILYDAYCICILYNVYCICILYMYIVYVYCICILYNVYHMYNVYHIYILYIVYIYIILELLGIFSALIACSNPPFYYLTQSGPLSLYLFSPSYLSCASKSNPACA